MGPAGQELLITDCFQSLQDPRRTKKGNIRYSLQEIIFLTLSAVVSGYQTYELIEGFGKLKLDWLREFYPYKNGVPSHDTLGDFFSRICPIEFSKCLIHFTESIAKHDTKVIALDGKTVKAFTNKDGYPLHIMTAFCAENKMSLGQEVVEGKENEIVAIPRLLDLICIKNAIITIDAMGCQTAIANKIVENGGEYVLQVKNNQKELLENIEDSFPVKPIISTHITNDCGHGRVEERKCEVINDLEFIENVEKWKDIKSIVRVTSKVFNKKTQVETLNTRYYISSMVGDAELLNTCIRSHWTIENNLHWNLDVVFKEDNQAKRNKVAIENINLISKTAIVLLDQAEPVNKSKNKNLKRQKAFASDTYREKVLKV